jgi:hypothetical protein
VTAEVIKLIGVNFPVFLSPTNLIIFSGTQNSHNDKYKVLKGKVNFCRQIFLLYFGKVNFCGKKFTLQKSEFTLQRRHFQFYIVNCMFFHVQLQIVQRWI